MVALALALTLVVGGRALPAQGGETAAIVLEQPAGARALALGGALVAVPDHDASLFSNPALLHGAGTSASISGQRFIAASTLGAASAGGRAFGGTVAIGIRALDYGSEDEFVPDTARFGGQRGMATGATVSASEAALSVGYARRSGRLRVGVAAGLTYLQIANESGTAPSVDLGVAVDLPRGIIAGAVVQNVGTDLPLASTASPLPRMLRAGVSVPLALGPLDALVVGEAGLSSTDEVVPRAGLELSWRSVNGITLSGRAGTRGGELAGIGRTTFGGGIAASRVSLEYAYQSLETLGGSAHRIGLRYRR